MRLFPLQEAGVKHLLTPMPSGRLSKLLAWDMGTGKTPIACVSMKRIKARRGLVICPAGDVKTQWAAQMVTWGVCAADDIFIVSSTTDVIPDAEHVIVNYELLLYDFILDQLITRRFDYIVVDEAQRLKDPGTKITQRVLGRNRKNARPALISRGKYRWFLSGTIAPNLRTMELFAMLMATNRDVIAPYTNYELYGRRFCGWKFRSASHLDDFRERTKDFISHVKLRDVYDQLPGLGHSEVYFGLGREEELEHLHRTGEVATIRKILGDLMVPHAIKYIKQRLEDEPEEKLVIFAWTRSVIEAIEAAFPGQAVKAYGGMTANSKREAKEAFVNNPKIKLFIGQIRVAGTGVDGLQSASCKIISVEPDWVPGDDDQMTGRLLRIGQRRDVHVTRLLASNTLHEVIHWGRKGKQKNILFNKFEKGAPMLEQFLEVLTRIAVALEAMGNAAAPAAGTTAKGTDAKAPATDAKAAKGATKSKKLTVDDLRVLSSSVIKTLSGGEAPTEAARKKVKDVLKSVGGVGKFDDLDVKKVDAVAAAINALLDETEEAGNDEDDLEV